MPRPCAVYDVVGILAHAPVRSGAAARERSAHVAADPLEGRCCRVDDDQSGAGDDPRVLGVAKHAGPLTEHPAEEIKAIPASTLIPKSELPEAANAILRVVRCEKDACIRLCDEVLLALLIYAGLRAQAACDIQFRDLAVAP